MDDLEHQIQTWADAAAPEGAGDPVTTYEVRAAIRREDVDSGGVEGPEVVPGPMASLGVDGRSERDGGGVEVERGHRTESEEGDLVPASGGRWTRRRWLAAAAVVGALAAVGAVVVAATGGDETEPLEVGTTTSSTSTTEADPLAGPVGFEVLAIVPGDRLRPWGPSTVARTRGEVAQLWADAGRDAPSPTIDPEDQVVVTMRVATESCPETLDGFEVRGFERDGATIEPRVVTTAPRCDVPEARSHTFVLAMDWATVGDAFTLHVPAQEGADLPEVNQAVERLPAEPEVEVTWELDQTTVAAGDPLSGEVTVVNHSGAPVGGTTCGPFFVVRLRGPDAEQLPVRPQCASTFSLPEGSSSYELEGVTTFTTCSSGPSLVDTEPCGPGGTLPDLPPGTYEALLDQATPGLVPPPDPIEVTIT